MFQSSVNNNSPSVAAPQHRHQQQGQQSDSLESQLQHLHQQQAQQEAMRILQQQHLLPNIVAPKQDHLGLLQDPPSGPWSSQDYDSMMCTLMNAALPSDHFTDSFSASYAGSLVSGSSDSGASPNSINDLVYGSANFPTPPESDMCSSARNLSFSLASHHHNAFSPDASLDLSNASYPQSYSGSDTMSPFAHNFNIHSSSSSSTSPFGLHTVQRPPASLPANSASPSAPSQVGDHSNAAQQQWNPNFLAPNATVLQPSLAPQPDSADLSSTSVPSSSSQVNGTSKKKRAGGDADDNQAASSQVAPNLNAKKAATTTAPKAQATDPPRKTKKAKATLAPSELKPSSLLPSSTAAPLSQLSSKLPHMEVGSNATALAAIERLKAKRLQQSQAAAAASQDPSQAAGSGPTADKPQLDPATRQQKKVAHNVIERRYRNNINDRIAALRRAVPALCEIRPRKTPSGRRSRKAQQEEDLVDGVPAATKLNKATILGKATDYIKYLKSRELRLASEVAGLRELVRSLEGGEELLELWEAEMDKVVAEQEAFAAVAAAKEEQEAEEASGNAQGEDDDDQDDDDQDDDDQDDDDQDDDAEEDEDEADAGESFYNSASSSSPPSATSRTGSKAGRGRRSGIGGALSSVASSRYMLATLLGISLIGSATEFALDATASDGTVAVGRPAAGKLMVGASSQLLKRSATYMAPTTSIAQESHAFDAVPTHALAFEVLRIVSFVFCFLLLVWPLFSRLFAAKSRCTRSLEAVDESDAELEAGSVGESRKLRLALTKGDMDVATFDTAVRSHIDAPVSAILAAPSVIVASSRLALSRVSRIHKLVPSQRLDNEEAAALGRLLEVETLCEAKAQSSAMLRLSTALRLANSEYVGGKLPITSIRDPILATPRLKATLALSLARLGEGVDSVQDLADQLWTEARTSLRLSISSNANSTGAIAPSASEKDQDLTQTEDASWLSSVLSLDLDTALELLAIASSTVDPRDCDFSAVLAIADVHYCSRLTSVWEKLLASLVRASCPSVSESHTSSLVRCFATLQCKQRLDLDVVRDAVQRKVLHTEITSLARTAPPTSRAWQMAQVTLATWSAILGNLALTRHVASILGEHPSALEKMRGFACVSTLHSFVNTTSQSAAVTVTKDDLDAKATLFISWLSFLRTFADPRTTVKDLHSATLRIRKLVAAATTCIHTTASALQEEEPEDLQSSLDLITDLCTALGSRVNRLPSVITSVSGNGGVGKLLIDAASDDERDSGVEV
ncbi:uncharacterized protein UHOD_07413 [Ustilago sp. UG-2017b]|nr:uncharacterized protein UHOD_07413 [Ustilago sp. UG-2017b]